MVVLTGQIHQRRVGQPGGLAAVDAANRLLAELERRQTRATRTLRGTPFTGIMALPR